MGNCLAGETCIFSHDPTKLVSKMSLESGTNTPTRSHSSLMLQDMNSFPSLQSGDSDQHGAFVGSPNFAFGIGSSPGLRSLRAESPRPRSRPGSRHQVKENHAVAPALDDNEAFPSLGSAIAKQGKKHHGKRGGHGHKENGTPSSLADIVKMNPPASPRLEVRKPVSNGNGTVGRDGENSAAALAIPSPKHIPWLETGEHANKAYLKARQDAIKHGGLRNKFLQRYVYIALKTKRIEALTTTISALLKHGTATMPEPPRLLVSVARARMT